MNNPTTTFSAQRMKSVVYIWCPRCPNGSVKIHHNDIGACSDCGLEYQATVQITALPAPVEIPTEEARARENVADLVARIAALEHQLVEIEDRRTGDVKLLLQRLAAIQEQMQIFDADSSGAVMARKLGDYLRSVR